MHEKIIVVVDLGTSQITAVAAQKNDRDVLTVLAVRTTKADGCILRGRIYNVKEVTSKVESLVSYLEGKLDATIDKIYVGVGGQSVRATPHTIIRELEEETVSKRLLDNIQEECLNSEPEGVSVLGVCSPEYILDGRYEQNPKGVQCQKIEVRYQLIVGRPSYERDLVSIEKHSGIQIEGRIPSIEAAAAAVLSSAEKEFGCVLVDFGAGTTSIAIYKNHLLKFYTTLPIGSDAITKDLTSLNMTEEEAEAYKTSQGEVTATEEQKENQIIEARIDEILTNIVTQIKHAGFEAIPAEGMVIVGGGAQMNGLAESIQDRLKCKVRVACAQNSLFIQEELLTSSPQYAQIVGLLALAKNNCATINVEKPKEEERDLFGSTTIVDTTNTSKGDTIKPGTGEDPPVVVGGRGTGRPPKKGPIGSLFDKLVDKVEKAGEAFYKEDDNIN